MRYTTYNFFYVKEYNLIGDDFIKKIIKILILFIICLNINIKVLGQTKKLESTAITTFEEYEEQFEKIDYIILIVAPSIIIGIGTLYYFKRTKRL